MYFNPYQLILNKRNEKKKCYIQKIKDIQLTISLISNMSKESCDFLLGIFDRTRSTKTWVVSDGSQKGVSCVKTFAGTDARRLCNNPIKKCSGHYRRDVYVIIRLWTWATFTAFPTIFFCIATVIKLATTFLLRTVTVLGWNRIRRRTPARNSPAKRRIEIVALILIWFWGVF